jgi:hypothetical protein
MPQTIDAKRRPSRAKLSQPMRVRPYHSQLPEEICVTQNVSRRGFYFETSLGHYFAGMYMHVTRNFHSGDPMSREEAGDVVRVERLETRKWGVAIRFLAGFGRPRTPEAAPANVPVNQDLRRTRRARIKIPLLIYGNTPEDAPFLEETHTIEINAHGALVAMETIVPPGERLFLTNETNDKTQECIVLAVRAKRGQDQDDAVAVAFSTPAPRFWRKSETLDHP